MGCAFEREGSVFWDAFNEDDVKKKFIWGREYLLWAVQSRMQAAMSFSTKNPFIAGKEKCEEHIVSAAAGKSMSDKCI